MNFFRSMPFLQVSSVPETCAFFERMGFVTNASWAEEEGAKETFFAIVQRGSVTVGVQLLRTRPLPVNTHHAIYIYVDDVDTLHAEFLGEGLEPDPIVRHTEFECDDFELRTPDGYRLCFGFDRSGEANGPGLGANRGKSP